MAANVVSKAFAGAALSIILVPGVQSQVLEISGGSSSLYQAHGGMLRLHGSDYDASLGAGTIGGRFMGSAQLKMRKAGSDYTLGTDTIAENLHTDIFDTDHYMMAIGAGVRTRTHGTDVFAFGGGASADYDSPLFAGSRAQNLVGMLFLHRQLAPGFTADTQAIVSDRQTVIESAEWKASGNVTLAASGGIGSNQPYGAISLVMNRKWMDLKAAYIEAGSGFRRLDVKTPLFAEPEHENAILTFHPTSFFSLSAGRQNYLVPQYPAMTSIQSQVNEGSAEVQFAGFSLSGSIFESDYQNRKNLSKIYTASKDLSKRVHIQCSYLESQTAQMAIHPDFITQVQESVTRRWDVSELMNTANGNTTISFGGGFISNLLTATVDYQTYYVPANASKPFEQALMLDSRFHLFNGVSAHAATLVSATGHLLYTTDMEEFVEHDAPGAPAGDNTLERAAVGSMLLRGQVQDTAGHPIAGAALMVDQVALFTDDDGFFFLRERRSHSHQLKVLTDQFLGGGRYRVVSAPATTRSWADQDQPETVIVVERTGVN